MNLTVTDQYGASISLQFTVSIINSPPENIASISDLTVYDNISFTQVLNFSNYFRDNDTDQTLHYSVANVPSFMSSSISGDIVTFTGNATAANIGTNYTIQLVVTDLYKQATANFKVIVLENHPPVANTSTFYISLLEDQTGSVTIPSFTDADGDTITYT